MTYAFPKEVEKELEKEHECYVLITCEAPDKEGNMKVKMIHKGDKVLASYLLEGAQDLMEESIEIC